MGSGISSLGHDFGSCSVRILSIQVVVYLDKVIQRYFQNARSERGVQIIFHFGIRSAHVVIPTPECILAFCKPLNPASVIEAHQCRSALRSLNLSQLAGPDFMSLGQSYYAVLIRAMNKANVAPRDFLACKHPSRSTKLRSR